MRCEYLDEFGVFSVDLAEGCHDVIIYDSWGVPICTERVRYPRRLHLLLHRCREVPIRLRIASKKRWELRLLVLLSGATAYVVIRQGWIVCRLNSIGAPSWGNRILAQVTYGVWEEVGLRAGSNFEIAYG